MNNIDKALINIPRHIFLPDTEKDKAELDIPLPIGYSQTNSQPYTVKNMLIWLDPQPGDKVLDVGSGSGWTSGLMSYLVGPKGKVIAVERIPELVNIGKTNCRKLKLKNIHFYEAGNKFGMPSKAPFDRILVSASALELPDELIDQLKAPGTMVIPIENSIFILSKDISGQIKYEEHPGFVFVPLIRNGQNK